jgi:hypothetical protein
MKCGIKKEELGKDAIEKFQVEQSQDQLNLGKTIS